MQSSCTTFHFQKWDQRLQDEADENLAKALCDNFLQDIPECKEIWKDLQDIKKGRKDLRYEFFCLNDIDKLELNPLFTLSFMFKKNSVLKFWRKS